jgi:hypothetical protein
MRWLSLFLACQRAEARGRIFVSARIRFDSRFKQFLCFVLIDAICLRVSKVVDYLSRKCGSLDVSQSHGPPLGSHCTMHLIWRSDVFDYCDQIITKTSYFHKFDARFRPIILFKEISLWKHLVLCARVSVFICVPVLGTLAQMNRSLWNFVCVS